MTMFVLGAIWGLGLAALYEYSSHLSRRFFRWYEKRK